MKRSLAGVIAVIAPAVLLAGAGSSQAIRLNDAPVTPHSNKIVVPVITASIGQSSYKPGDTMTITVTENIWAKRTFSVSDTNGTVWTQRTDDNKSVTFTATAPSRSGVAVVTMTRTFDRATASAAAGYTVVAPTPPPPPPPPPPTPTPTPTPTDAAFPGQVPGKFYLGMSCGTACSDKASQLGQSYGVHRQYKNWGDWKGVANDITEDRAAGRLPWISIKPPQSGGAGWRAIASGSYDAAIKDLAATLKANDDEPVLITLNHEPSNDGTEAEGKDWAAAYVRFHDVLKAEGALANVADPPILGDWLFNPVNRQQDPANWVTPAVLQRMPFMGVDMYQNESGETFAVRIPRIIDWMADQGYDKMIGIGETGATDAYPGTTAIQWMNDSLNYVAAHTDQVAVVSYFNSMNNSRAGVYWPLDESSSKLSNYRGWLDKTVTID